ncbi:MULTISPECIES: peptidoglycan-binding protein [unclassified Novosphingobium]|uniref:peptidoglycan-binding protein n=1 Tax=unclassified Novosphingobium TaxID=2644732 RepID=UPI00135C40CD|nr:MULTISPECIES: peptidoglycan-binding protein [unclassified Novosphingobium]
MIDGPQSSGVGASNLTAAQKANLIYNEARSELSGRLWRAALGSAEDDGRAQPVPGQMAAGTTGEPIGLDRLLAMLAPATHAEAAASAAVTPQTANEPPAIPVSDDAVIAMQDGPNARYAGMLDAAAARTGIPASALAAIVDAEAAKGAGGTWQPYSRNPRSSAAGLGQFLNKSWEGEAERAGTWLNTTAHANGWLNAKGQIKSESRSALLALRYDPRASIEAVADYASANVEALRGSGVQIGGEVSEVARAAYLGHHLGLGDARRFLAGGLAPERARRLLNAQVGGTDTERRIAKAGGAVAAHRTWLLDYVGRHVRPEKFA